MDGIQDNHIVLELENILNGVPKVRLLYTSDAADEVAIVKLVICRILNQYFQ